MRSAKLFSSKVPSLGDVVKGAAPLVTVSGTITELDPDRKNRQGARHQVFSIRIDQVIDDAKQAGVTEGQVMNVAVRYGDAEGLPKPVPGLAVNQSIKVRGAYVEQAYAEPDGDLHAVIHYAHHPVGWVEYQGQRYE